MMNAVTIGAVERERERACFKQKSMYNLTHYASRNCLTNSVIRYTKNKIDIKNKDRPYLKDRVLSFLCLKTSKTIKNDSG